MSNYAFVANNWVTSRRIVQNPPTALSVEQRGTYLQSVLQRTRTADQWMKDENSEQTRETKITKLAGRNGNMHRINHNFQTETTDASTVQETTRLMTALPENNIRPQPRAILLAVQVFTKIIINFKTHHLTITHPNSSSLSKASLE